MLGRFLKNIKLKNKLLAILISALLLVFVGTMLFSFIPYQAYDEQLYAASVQTLSLFAGDVENRLDDYVDLSYQMLSDDVIQSNLTIMRKHDMRTEAWRTASNSLVDHLVSYSNTIENVVCFRVRSVQGMDYNHSRGRSALTADDLSALEQTAREAEGSAVWVTLPEPTSRIILVRDIREVDGLSFASLAKAGIKSGGEKQ